jgi:hypothetical protein
VSLRQAVGTRLGAKTSAGMRGRLDEACRLCVNRMPFALTLPISILLRSQALQKPRLSQLLAWHVRAIPMFYGQRYLVFEQTSGEGCSTERLVTQLGCEALSFFGANSSETAFQLILPTQAAVSAVSELVGGSPDLGRSVLRVELGVEVGLGVWA